MNRSRLRGAGLLAGFAIFFAFPPRLASHDPITTKLTWTQEISRIVYKRCAGCHHPGGSAFSLIAYEEARPWAKAIRDEVLTRRMPPWGAVKGIGSFANDPSLSQPEIDMFVIWVEGGAPEGEAVYLPAYVPARPMSSEKPAGKTIEAHGELTLREPLKIGMIRPKDVPDGGEIEAWATQPNGAVERLIWIRDYASKFPQTYILTQPLILPAGARLHVSGPGTVLIYTN